jgi:DNA-binding IclR family transcriptional regulator
MVVSDGAVKSAERVASLLELLGQRKKPLRLIEIAQALNIPKSSAHGLLQTLVNKELVVRDDAQRYRLGIKLFSLAAAALEPVDIREVARPWMEELCAKTRATCNLAVLDGHDVLYIEKIEDRSSPVRLVTHVGTRIPAHVTALGKVLVGELPQPERKGWLADHPFTRMTDHTRMNATAFSRDLKTYQKNGFAVDDQGLHEAIIGFAAPVRDHTGVAIAALSLTRLGLPVDAEAQAAIGAEVCATASAISRALRSPISSSDTVEPEDVRRVG